ncbi:MAG TPA: STAS domain-containing protein [Mariprofundaceae bacterium]|nr:STAS domain-containing protein [Mariprofundaceae bacterium]
MSIQVSSKQVGSEAVVYIDGHIDAHSSPVLRRELAKLFGSSLQTIRVQLDDVRQMDSSGIATLSEGLQWSRRSGGRFVLSGLSKPIADVLELAKLDQVFDIDQHAGGGRR